jgi:EpsI family protein
MTTKRLLIVLAVLVAGFGSIFLLPQSAKTSPAGIAMSLPGVIGMWFGEDAEITQREREVLAKDTQFARKTYTGPEGDQIYVSIVLSGDDMVNSIHRPERCLPAQGWAVQTTERRTIPVANGAAIEATRLRNRRMVKVDDQKEGSLINLNYYWFIGHNEMTASHLIRTGYDIRDRILYGYNQRWAYVTVSAIVTEGWTRNGRSEAETTQMVEDFIRELVPRLKTPEGQQLLLANR